MRKNRNPKSFAALILAAVLGMTALSGCGAAADGAAPDETGAAQAGTEAAETPASETPALTEADAVYLGVENYGAPETNRENMDHFGYRFLVGGEETVLAVDNGAQNEEGGFDYPIQNLLKEGYSYRIVIADGTVVSAEETGPEPEPYAPAVSGAPGEPTLANFLRTAMMPVGTTLYIYGGGWDWQDEGSSIQTRTIGVSPDWVRFFGEHDASFTFKGVDNDEENVDPTTSYYPYGEYNEYYYAGLDCSGYVGWALYNTFETADGGEGFVGGSTGFARRLSERGWGTWTQEDVPAPGKTDAEETEAADETVGAAADGAAVMLPGDIMSINGHVWISLGTCADGSVVIAHSTPSLSRTGQPGGGVQIGAIGPDADCEAHQLAERYMSEYFPEWYERYDVPVCSPDVYFSFEGENAGRFTWDVSGANGGLTDPEGMQRLTPEEVLETLFS